MLKKLLIYSYTYHRLHIIGIHIIGIHFSYWHCALVDLPWSVFSKVGFFTPFLLKIAFFEQKLDCFSSDFCNLKVFDFYYKCAMSRFTKKKLSKLMFPGFWICLYLIFHAFNHHFWGYQNRTRNGPSIAQKTLFSANKSWKTRLLKLPIFDY